MEKADALKINDLLTQVRKITEIIVELNAERDKLLAEVKLVIPVKMKLLQ